MAWNAFGQPQTNTVVLINRRGEVEMVAPMADLEAVAARAKDLAAMYEAWDEITWSSLYDNQGHPVSHS
jgi:hypothetical protein